MFAVSQCLQFETAVIINRLVPNNNTIILIWWSGSTNKTILVV